MRRTPRLRAALFCFAIVSSFAVASDDEKEARQLVRDITLKNRRTLSVSVQPGVVESVDDTHVVVRVGESSRKLPLRRVEVIDAEFPRVGAVAGVELAEGNKVEVGTRGGVTYLLKLKVERPNEPDKSDGKPERPAVTIEGVTDILDVGTAKKRTAFALLPRKEQITLIEIAWDIKNADKDKQEYPRLEGTVHNLRANSHYLPRIGLRNWLLSRWDGRYADSCIAFMNIPGEQREAVRLEIALLPREIDAAHVASMARLIEKRGLDNLSDEAKQFVRLNAPAFGLEKPTATVQWLIGETE